MSKVTSRCIAAIGMHYGQSMQTVPIWYYWGMQLLAYIIGVAFVQMGG